MKLQVDTVRALVLNALHWDLAVPPHTVKVEFLDSSGQILAYLTKTISFNVPEGKDKVVFISDQSITPQNT